MATYILGISAFYHDSGAVLLRDGHIVAAAQEERFTRKKHDAAFPASAVSYVLSEGALSGGALEAVAFYDKPFLKFERLLETYVSYAPRGLKSFRSAMPVWIREKLFMKSMLRKELEAFGAAEVPLFFPEHHLSHGASAFYPSPFEDAAILTMDGVGEWAATTIGHGRGSSISLLREQQFPHSLGLLYSAFTYYCGFRVNSGEYKLMGLAPYGNPGSPRVEQWKRAILEELLSLKEDGSFFLNMRYFDFATGLRMCNHEAWKKLFGLPWREPETPISQEYMDLALAIQDVTEEIVLRLAASAREATRSRNLVLAGGVALNCVANGRILREAGFDGLWIQPAAGDAGGALGAALAVWHIEKERPRRPLLPPAMDAMQGSYLGPSFTDRQIENAAALYGGVSEKWDHFSELCRKVAELLDQGNVVGWFQGRMEWGPRALGNRSILGDSRHPEMQKKLNLKIKYREGFRPFAPSVLREECAAYFDLDSPSPYMLLVAPVQEDRRNPLPEGYASFPLLDKLYHLRSDIPAVTHIDYSARVQTVHRETNPRYWELLSAFKERTGYGLLVNTSFNVRGEPIVCTPEDAYRCFMRTEMDYLVMGSRLFDKSRQPEWSEGKEWQQDFVLD